MNNVRCLIVDDEPIAQRIIASYLMDLKGFEIVGACLNALDAMQILESTDVDLMFLDIEMPKLKGLAFLKLLDHPPQVIITTAHREYALEGFDLAVIDYLLKPISFERFIKAINRFRKNHTASPDTSHNQSAMLDDVIYVKSDRKTLKLSSSDIVYVEGMNNYIVLHTSDQRHVVYNSLAEMVRRLGSKFKRIHKSYVVNIDHVSAFNKEVVLIGDKELPIGKAYKKVVEEL